MFKYMVIPLCDSAVSFCHYKGKKEKRLIDIETLKKATRFSMIENLTIQFVYPDYALPTEYQTIIDEVEHGIVCNAQNTMEADVYVCHSINEIKEGKTNLLRIKMDDLLQLTAKGFTSALVKAERMNVVVTDVEGLTEETLRRYGEWLDSVANEVAKVMKDGKEIACNLITDRVSLEKMNNCNAGDESIALMPDGKFYVCPAFYYNGGESVGDLENGVVIPNKQLYKIENAPICRNCDAWQCRRCVWLNEKMTLEVNTPSREQCVMAHLERKASRRLVEALKLEVEIKKLEYLDPFEEVTKN